MLGDPDLPHTYTFIPDIGEGLAVPGEVWHLPNNPATRTTRDLIGLAAGGRARVRQIPPILSRLAAREVWEMRYLFEEPFVVDSTKIAEKLQLRATSYEEAIDRTLASYRAAGL